MFNPTLIKRLLASGVVIAATGLPAAAQARYAEDPGGPPSTFQVPVTGSQPASQVASVPSARGTASSFQWGDAGIGAAGVTVLIGAGGLGVAMSHRRRADQAAHS